MIDEKCRKFLTGTLYSQQEIEKKYQELNALARKAQAKYYNNDSEGIELEDREYDILYDRIAFLEKHFGIKSKTSVTQTAGISSNVKGGKVKHEELALSADKTKNRNDLVKFIKNKEGLLSLKEDGLTLVATFKNGKLVLLATRGNGVIGDDITDKGQVLNCIPKTIPDKGHVVVRGEFLCSYDDFKRLNTNNEYRHPRNFASGTLSLKDLNEVKRRQGEFHVFDLVKCSDIDKLDTYEKQLQYCKQLGFQVVEYKKVNAQNMLQAVGQFENTLKTLDHPTDGLVLRFNDIAYGDSLGMTSHAPRYLLAFKWKDDVYETILRDIEWSPSKTGKINPVAIFDPVDIDGVTVSKASLYNISFIKRQKLGIGDRILVYRANMVIPTLQEDLDKRDNIQIPTTCPACSGPVKIYADGAAEILICDNPDCPAKNLQMLEHFTSRNAMNIEGISGSTIEAIVDKGILHNFSDFYDLPKHKNILLSIDKFGEKAYTNLCNALEKSKNINEPYRLLYSLSIPNVGEGVAKDALKILNNDYTAFLDPVRLKKELKGLGNVVTGKILDYFDVKEHRDELQKLLNIVNIAQPKPLVSTKLQGKNICITGSLQVFKNRKELEASIQENGGIVADSVNKNTNLLINNDINSSSAKNIKAKQLGILIITEQEYIDMVK